MKLDRNDILTAVAASGLLSLACAFGTISGPFFHWRAFVAGWIALGLLAAAIIHKDKATNGR